MTRTVSVFAFSAALFACLLASSAQAQVTRTFVSGTGTANSLCSYTEPCRFFTQALAALPSKGGEIDVLDPGSYGQITITNSVSIIGRGWTTITATPSTAAITITGSGSVSISGVQLEGGGTGENGISFTGGGSLTIRDSTIRNFSRNGIDFEPGSSSSTKLYVSNTLVAENGNAGFYLNANGPGAAVGILNHVEVENNAGSGVQAIGTSAAITVTVADSAVSNGGPGIVAGDEGGTSDVMVRNSTIANNTRGVEADNVGATIRVTRSTITGNMFAWAAVFNGSVLSYGDNNIDNNTNDNSEPPNPLTYR
jgi:Right handed beta helix region